MQDQMTHAEAVSKLAELAEENELLRAAMRFEWDEAGEPMTFAAAASDADEWLALIERLHNEGQGPWKFSEPDSLEKLLGCRNNMRRFLPPNVVGKGRCAALYRAASSDRRERP